MESSKNPSPDSRKALRVCYFGTYRAEYSRNQIMIESLRQAGVEVKVCHAQLWKDIEDRVQLTSGGWGSPAFWFRAAWAYLRLLVKYLRAGPYDVMVVGYPGQFDVFLARLLTRLSHKPLVWDIFMSIYLIAVERGLDQKSPRTVDVLRKIEKKACSLPDLLLLDTAEYVAWFGQTHGIPTERFRLVPTGADDRIFHPRRAPRRSDGRFRVVYYGTYISNHNVPFIVEAARCLQDEQDISFEFIGNGPERIAAENSARLYGLRNVTFTDWMDQEALARRVAEADVCLGAFGHTPQSLMTVQNKIYEGLAMAKPVITGDSRALRSAFTHGDHLVLVGRDDPKQLAQAIRTLRDQPELLRRIALQGYELFRRQYALAQLGMVFKRHVESFLETHFKQPAKQ